MGYVTFDELNKQLQTLFQEEQFGAAFDLANAALEKFPDQSTILEYWRITLAALSGDNEAALSALEEALKYNCWYSEMILRRSPSLKQLQTDPRFEVLITRNQQIAEIDQSSQFPYYILRPKDMCREGAEPCRLLIGLHTSGGTAASSIDYWKPAAKLGWLVAAPQSSQALMKGVYVWDDRQIAEREIRKDFQSISEHYNVNSYQSVLAGHSSGGELAIWLTIKGALEINYFMAIGPTGPLIDDLDQWQTLLLENQRTGLRGYIIAGELDETLQIENLAEMAAMFTRTGIETEIEIVPGMVHEFEPAFEEAIIRSLNFLTG